MSRRHKKILPNFCCSERRERRRERRKMIKKILPNLCSSAKLYPDVVMLQSLHFSQALCDHPSSCILWSPPPAVFRLVHMLGFPLHVQFVRSSRSPPTRRGPRAV